MTNPPDNPRPRRLRVELPEQGVSATVELYSSVAPTVTELIYASVETPLETRTAHACFDGHEVFCFLPAFPVEPPIENRTMRPRPGEVMFFHARPNEFACVADDRLSGGAAEIYELAFMYGEIDLRHYWEEGFHGSLVGRVIDGLEPFAAACVRTLADGSTVLRVSQDRKVSQ